MGPFEAMEFALQTYLAADNLAAAVAVSEKMLPCVRPKVGALVPDAAPLPADLQPNPEPTSDQPGPENPVL